MELSDLTSSLDEFVDSVEQYNEENKGSDLLTYDDWLERFLEVCNKDTLEVLTGKKSKLSIVPIDYSKPIVIAKSDIEIAKILKDNEKELQRLDRIENIKEKQIKRTQLFKEIITPAMTLNKINWRPVLEVADNKIPIWFNTTSKGINIRLGFLDEDRSKPYALTLGDNCVHGKLGGITGSGKSVTLNDILMNLLIEYAPWEIILYLMDFKFVELSKYANPPAPHVQVIGATDSTEYITSLLDNLKATMILRQKNFMTLGVEKTQTFREVFKQVMPRTLLLVDEFAQLFENLKEQDDTDGKQIVNASIRQIGKLGRNAGFHMLLSSQDLSEGLDDAADKQFTMGIALKSDTGVSRSLIGNDKAADIQEKGLVYGNSNRNKPDNEKQNMLFRSPYIPSELSDKQRIAFEEACSLALQENRPLPDEPPTYLKERLIQLKEISDELGTSRSLQFFNVDETVSIEDFYKDLDLASEIEAVEKENNRNVLKTLALGRTTRYREGCQLETFNLELVKSNNILIAAKNTDDFIYCTDLLIKNLKDIKGKGVVVKANEDLADKLKIDEIMPNTYSNLRPVVPEDIFGILEVRKMEYDLQLYMMDNLSKHAIQGDIDKWVSQEHNLSSKQKKYWSTPLALEYFYNLYKSSRDPAIDFSNRKNFLVDSLCRFIEKLYDSDFEFWDFREFMIECANERLGLASGSQFGSIEIQGEENKPHDYTSLIKDEVIDYWIDIVSDLGTCMLDFRDFTNFEERLMPKHFNTFFLWIVGFEDMEDITDPDDPTDMRTKLMKFLQNAPKYNMITIATTNNINSRLDVLYNRFNLIVDKTSRACQMDLSLPIKKDMTEERTSQFISFQCRSDKSKYVTVKKYFTN